MGPGCGGWSFLHAVSTTNCREPTKPDQKSLVYVHSLARASSLRLSPRSLKLCTENLGSESGNIVPFDNDNDGDPRGEIKKGEEGTDRPEASVDATNCEPGNASEKAKPRTNVNNSNKKPFTAPMRESTKKKRVERRRGERIK
ncbi:protein FANTASTIC FOUR 2-like [Rhodamnia argentea]|uniref:Protein FANTASTIC FOUR 2-like n=1 Tax=Rhodamnia argentea TaxID=178133 RepID=A0ABM3H6F3_9MYRT|nr:protein FANTASTIC FOUR 2-like [Rhodamnia argentea]